MPQESWKYAHSSSNVRGAQGVKSNALLAGRGPGSGLCIYWGILALAESFLVYIEEKAYSGRIKIFKIRILLFNPYPIDVYVKVHLHGFLQATYSLIMVVRLHHVNFVCCF